ncbi:MAG: hypothetical protein ICV60_05745 [Pyrinomonadaceae bacterium]|nr:hypothetical protein [Pyrinomonadaceae bacterium]
MASRKQPQTRAIFDRARAAAERMRAKLAEQTGGQYEVDFRTAPLSWWRERWADRTIRRQFIENFIYIRDLETNQLVLLKYNDMQDDLDEHLTGKDVVLKMRKGGSSTLHLARKFANAVVLGGRTVRIFAHNPKTEAKLRRDVRVMYRYLPSHLKPKAKKTASGGLELLDDERGESTIETIGVQPGFEDNPRGDTITDVLITEMPYMRGDTRAALTAILEACAPGADITDESTAGGIEVFHSVYQDGKNKRGGWTAHFYEWWWRRDCRREGAYIFTEDKQYFIFDPSEPDAKRNEQPITSAERKVCARILQFLIKRKYLKRGAKWYAPEVAEYLAWRRAKIEERGEKTFLVEYPENDKDCFEQTGRPVIRADYLKVTCDPSEPLEGHEYWIGVDTSAGTERGNPAAIQVIDFYDGRQVYEERLKLSPDLLAYHVASICDRYSRAKIVPERNNTGYATVLKLIELGYEDVVYKHFDAPTRRALEDGRITPEEAAAKSQFGFPTDRANKPLAGIALEEAVRKGELGLSSQLFCDQALTVVWHDDGGFSALSGYEDDLFMALAIVWLVARTMMGTFTGFMDVVPEAGDARV